MAVTVYENPGMFRKGPNTDSGTLSTCHVLCIEMEDAGLRFM